MRYKQMRLLCFFDLPTITQSEKKDYSNFRKSLLKNGFVMIQYSVYMRACPNKEYSKKFIKNLNSYAPIAGNIRILTVTEKQYKDMFLVIGKKSYQEEVVSNKRLVVI